MLNTRALSNDTLETNHTNRQTSSLFCILSYREGIETVQGYLKDLTERDRFSLTGDPVQRPHRLNCGSGNVVMGHESLQGRRGLEDQ